MPRRLIACALGAALLLAACGRSDSESGSASTTSTTAGSAAPASGDFGTLKDVCQSGDVTGATAQGVTPTEIKVGTFADPGFVGRPGLDQELFDTAEVFSKWCNAAGGINGRKIVVNQHDSALFDVKARMTDACAQDFFLVGGGAVFDNQGVETRLQCLLPDIPGYVVTAEARGADLKVEPLPNPIDNIAIGEYRYLGKKFPASTKHVGILTGDLPTTVTVAKQAEEAAKKLGWDIVYSDQYPSAGPTSWAPYAQGMKDKGVEGLIWVGEPENLAKLQVDMKDVDFAPQWIRADTNHYDQKLLDTGGEAVANTYIPSSFVPFEQAAKNPATQQYLDEFAKYKPGAKAKALLGAAGVVGVAPLRAGGEGVRLGPHPHVRLRQRDEGPRLDRRRAPRHHRPWCQQGQPVLHAAQGGQREVHGGRRRAEHRPVQLQPQEPPRAQGRLRQGRHPRRRREVDQRPEVATTSGPGPRRGPGPAA